MPRQRSPNRDKAFEIYKEHKGNIKLKEIAEKLHVSDTQIRKWKSSDKWEQKLKGTLPLKSNVTNKNKSTNKEPMHQEVEEVLNNSKLTEKQRLFCSYYVKYRNKTKAYMKAYKCSYENAHAHAYELWRNVAIKNEIDKLLKELRGNIKIDIQDLIQLNIDIAFADMNDYMEFGQKEVPMINPKTGEEITNKDGKVITYTVNYAHFKNSSEVDGTLISEVSKGKDGAKIKLQDKIKAIDFLDKHIEYLDEETKHKLDIEHRRLENGKLKAETAKITGEDELETEDDGFLEALKARTVEVWKNE